MPRYVWLVLYVVCMLLVVWGMVSARHAALKSFGSSTAQSAWDQWRAKAKAESDSEGPVVRKQRESAQPPALVLMRDHFAACLGFALLLTSVLFATLAVMVHGAIARPGQHSCPSTTSDTSHQSN